MGDLSTKTISVTNRAEISDTDSDSWPILEQISRLGSSSDRESVLPDAGNLRIIDSIGSFGVERKFSDLFERYTLIDQPIEIFYASTQAETLDPASYTSVFKGKGLDWVISTDSVIPLIDIRFDARLFAKRFISRRVNNLDFTNAPSKSIGKHLPIVIGAGVQVRPVQISADGATIPTYAYATTLASEHPVSGVASYYVKDSTGAYLTVSSASNVSTAVISETRTHIGGAFRPTIQHAVRLNMSASDTYIITQAKVRFNGDNDIALIVNGVFELTILDHDDVNDIPGKVLGIAKINKNDYQASVRGASDFDVTFTFEKPTALIGSTYFYLAYRQTIASGDTGYFNFPAVDAADATRVRYTQSEYATSGQYGNLWTEKASSKDIAQYDLYALKLTDYPSGSYINAEGLSVAYFDVTQKTAIATNPDISKLDFIISVNGLKDDSSGSISGVADALIERVDHAVKLLAQEYSASTGWALSSSWSFSGYSSTYYQGNTIKGKSEGEETFEGFLRKICRNSAAKIVLVDSAQMALYLWGAEVDSSATFDQENSKIIRVSKLDASHVVNDLTIAYNKELITFDAINISTEGIPAEYTSVLRRNSDTNSSLSNLALYSESIYGKRYLSDIYFDLLASDTLADRIAQYYLTTFTEPPVYVQIEVPFEYYTTLDNLDVITIKHPSLPCYFGSSPNAQLPHFEGEEIDPNQGMNLTRAKRYRAQIEGIVINFNSDAVPTLLLTARLLLNPNDPT
jgi:hypothetical protein